ncbi:MAG: pyridoxamine 5'-phosphate oxidase family protein [Burkholderiaceae bacterium]
MITSLEALRALYPAPGERAVRKELASLETHSLNFIARSPFLVIATSDAEGALDASPRGGDPGFVKVIGTTELMIPDAPGNNRIDSLQNIVQTGQVGLIFMIPGIDETLRINGRAHLSDQIEDLRACADAKREPRLVIRVQVRQVYMHCAKAFMRSRLWQDSARQERGNLPNLGQIIRDQTGLQVAPETQEQMIARYQSDL